MNTIRHHAPTWLGRGLSVLTACAALMLLPASPSLAEAEAASDTAEARTAPGVVNLNTATEAELLRLPGVGASKAQAILEVRERLGGFQHVRQIVHVRGIGRATFRRLRPMLTLEGPTTLR